LSKKSPLKGNCLPCGTTALSYKAISPGFKKISTLFPADIE
jgi:hypothetical protein